MLIQFSFENYRSFRDSSTLSMLASSGKENPDNVFETSAGKLLKSVAVFGSNASGKSNLIKALAAAILIVRTTGVRQLDEPIPFVDRFLFDPDGKKDTSFEFDFIVNGKRYIYGFSCDGNTISEEHLLAYKTQKPTTIFKRIQESYQFTDSKYKQELAALVPRNTPNKLFLATATTWNATATREAFLWFSRFIDVYEPSNPIPMFSSYESDKDGGLKEFTKRLLKESDINITDYSIESQKVESSGIVGFGAGLKHAGPLEQKAYKINATHLVGNGEEKRAFMLPLQDESKGTQNLFFLSPQLKNAFDNGYVFCVDELDASLHPALLLYLVGLFNSEETNPRNAQLIITTHTTELLSTHYMRRDQIYFIDKDNDTAVSELYSLDEYSVRTREDVRKSYLNGKFGAVPNIG